MENSQLAETLQGILESNPDIDKAMKSFQHDVEKLNIRRMSDEDATKHFDRYNQSILYLLKNNRELVKQFDFAMRQKH